MNLEGTDRVRKAEVDAAARLIADQLGDSILMVFTNTSASQLHLILPKFEGARPSLRAPARLCAGWWWSATFRNEPRWNGWPPSFGITETLAS